ncbi:hypothetical protein [Rheinheimera sp.]|uniref:hypothetical protein n=1 Tax=Rheinheimera sp. TaxID=1869214 RepID=UPI00307E7886
MTLVNFLVYALFISARIFWPELSPAGEHALVIAAICYTALVSYRSPNTVGICALILLFHLVDIWAQKATYLNAYFAFFYYMAIDTATAAALLFRVPVFRNRLGIASAKYTMQDFIASAIFVLGAILAAAGFIEHVLRHLEMFSFLVEIPQDVIQYFYENARWVFNNFTGIKMFLNNVLLVVLFTLTLQSTRKEIHFVKM